MRPLLLLLLGVLALSSAGVAVQAVWCGQASDCGSCTQIEGCGYCFNAPESSGCVAGNATGPAPGVSCEPLSTWLFGSGACSGSYDQCATQGATCGGCASFGSGSVCEYCLADDRCRGYNSTTHYGGACVDPASGTDRGWERSSSSCAAAECPGLSSCTSCALRAVSGCGWCAAADACQSVWAPSGDSQCSGDDGSLVTAPSACPSTSNGGALPVVAIFAIVGLVLVGLLMLLRCALFARIKGAMHAALVAVAARISTSAKLHWPALFVTATLALKIGALLADQWDQATDYYSNDSISYGALGTLTNSQSSRRSGFESYARWCGRLSEQDGHKRTVCRLMQAGGVLALLTGICSAASSAVVGVAQLAALCKPALFNAQLFNVYRFSGFAALFSLASTSFWLWAGHFDADWLSVYDTSLSTSWYLMLAAFVCDVIVRVIYRSLVLGVCNTVKRQVAAAQQRRAAQAAQAAGLVLVPVAVMPMGYQQQAYVQPMGMQPVVYGMPPPQQQPGLNQPLLAPGQVYVGQPAPAPSAAAAQQGYVQQEGVPGRDYTRM